jgi:murein DD-endopeptidase MepM/ murein hydrolase activator NlpD
MLFAKTLPNFALAVVALLSFQSAFADNPPEPTEQQQQEAISALRERKLFFPISNFDVQRIKGSFDEMQGGVKHRASDIMAPAGTPIHAVEDGTIAKLFNSKMGGTTIYQFDKQKHFVFYYAHLQKYAEGIKDGMPVRKGEVLGFVGSSGDASPDAPHLHFEITICGKDGHWWGIPAIDPYLVFRK